jgi:hypothetical protein
MNRMISSVLSASALIFGVFLPREEAVAQIPKELVGTWTMVHLARLGLERLFAAALESPVAGCQSRQIRFRAYRTPSEQSQGPQPVQGPVVAMVTQGCRWAPMIAVNFPKR